MKLWLDDIRDPAKNGRVGYVWVKTADDAIRLLSTGEVTFASLDHDLAMEHYPFSGVPASQYREKTGYEVVCWLEQHPRFWPKHGVAVHSMNPAGRERMQAVIDRYYFRKRDRTSSED